MVGFKYKMSNIQAAIGCGQMERIDELIVRKREILQAYKQQLQGIEAIQMNPEPAYVENGAWMPTLVFTPESGINREQLQAAFARDNIDARVFFWPLSSLPVFEPVCSNVQAWSIPERAINLPSYHDISAADIQRVVQVVKGLLAELHECSPHP
jgi:perosamine synthetase